MQRLEHEIGGAQKPHNLTINRNIVRLKKYKKMLKESEILYVTCLIACITFASLNVFTPLSGQENVVIMDCHQTSSRQYMKQPFYEELQKRHAR